jgi:GDP-4-dehydro-6-deoxy-D-mannose reductase
MERALITGGTGFVGRHLVSFLVSRGVQVGVLASCEFSKEPSGVAFYEADVRDRDKVHSAMHDFKPHHVYHLAAISSVPFSWKSPRQTYEVNVLGTLNLFEAAISLPSPPRILNVSTAQVYGPSDSALSETSSVVPDNPYAASKLMAELLRIQFRNSSTGGVITARSFNHTGPGQSSEFVIPSIAKQFAEIEAGWRKPKLTLGNVHVRRDFTDVRDVVEAYFLLLQKGSVDETYNVCSGRARSIKEIVEEYELLSDIQVEIETHASKQRTGEVEEVCGDPVKIRATAGWTPAISWKKSLTDLLNYWRTELHDNLRNDSHSNDVEQPQSSAHLVSKR